MIGGIISVDNEGIVDVNKKDFIKKIKEIIELYDIEILFIYVNSRVLQICAKYLHEIKNKLPFQIVGFCKNEKETFKNCEYLFDKIIKTKENKYLICDLQLVIHKDYIEIQI